MSRTVNMDKIRTDMTRTLTAIENADLRTVGVASRLAARYCSMLARSVAAGCMDRKIQGACIEGQRSLEALGRVAGYELSWEGNHESMPHMFRDSRNPQWSFTRIKGFKVKGREALQFVSRMLLVENGRRSLDLYRRLCDDRALNNRAYRCLLRLARCAKPIEYVELPNGVSRRIEMLRNQTLMTIGDSSDELKLYLEDAFGNKVRIHTTLRASIDRANNRLAVAADMHE